MPGKKTKRPVHLDLLRIRLPIGGIVSILHRVSGVLLVLLLPFTLLALQRSLTSSEGYVQVTALLKSIPGRATLLVLVLLLIHHFLAGIRHLLLDIDVGISRAGSRRGAWLVIVGVALVAILIVCRLFL
jgi:succinate dehydrogenase / fumarate reductase cytochrome b subunit